MKRFFKFIGMTLAVVLGLALSSWLFGIVGELLTAKNSFAVAGGLVLAGVVLGTWLYVLCSGVAAFSRHMLEGVRADLHDDIEMQSKKRKKLNKRNEEIL